MLTSIARRGAVIVLAAAAGAAGCDRSAAQARAAAARQDQAVAIRTVPVQRISIQRQVDLAGTLLSPDQARVSSEVAGRVREVLVELGTEVRPGDPLVRLDPRELALALERAQSALEQTEAQLGMKAETATPPADDEVASVRTALATREDARANYERAQRLAQRGILSSGDLQNAETKLKLADASYEAAIDGVRSLRASLQDRRAAVELARKKVEDTTIRAPVGGAVSERLVQPGEYISERTPVATIVELNPLKLRTAVQERFAGVIRPGLPVNFRVQTFAEEVFRGKVAYVSPAVDVGTRTFAVEAMVDNRDFRLKPGFFAEGAIDIHVDENVLAVPEDAISTLAGVSTVYVVEEGSVRQQQVALGVRQGPLVEVVNGLEGGETLAASNLTQLSTGTAVAVGRSGATGAGGAPDQGAAGAVARVSGARGAGAPGGGGSGTGERAGASARDQRGGTK